MSSARRWMRCGVHLFVARVARPQSMCTCLSVGTATREERVGCCACRCQLAPAPKSDTARRHEGIVAVMSDD
jgi:hypothetical protein